MSDPLYFGRLCVVGKVATTAGAYCAAGAAKEPNNKINTGSFIGDNMLPSLNFTIRAITYEPSFILFKDID